MRFYTYICMHALYDYMIYACDTPCVEPESAWHTAPIRPPPRSSSRLQPPRPRCPRAARQAPRAAIPARPPAPAAPSARPSRPRRPSPQSSRSPEAWRLGRPTAVACLLRRLVELWRMPPRATNTGRDSAGLFSAAYEVDATGHGLTRLQANVHESHRLELQELRS